MEKEKTPEKYTLMKLIQMFEGVSLMQCSTAQHDCCFKIGDAILALRFVSKRPFDPREIILFYTVTLLIIQFKEESSMNTVENILFFSIASTSENMSIVTILIIQKIHAP